MFPTVTRHAALRATMFRRAAAEARNPTVGKQRKMQNMDVHYQHERASYWIPQYAGIRFMNITLTLLLFNTMVNVANNRKEVFYPCWRNFIKE